MTEPQQGATFEDQVVLAQTAERLGFTGYFRSDHLVAGTGTGMPGPTESWVTLAGIARETSDIRLGTLVTAAPFRHPSLLAMTVAQVDEMSGGRIDFGFGAGWWEYEASATGIVLAPSAERFDRFEEQLEILTGLWATPAGQTFSHAGAHWTLVDAPALPKPVQSPMPIIIGGSGKRRTPAIAARCAREYNSGWETPSGTAVDFTRVRAACAAIGRDAATLRMSTVQSLCVGESEAVRSRRAQSIGVDLERAAGMLTGSADRVIDRLGEYSAIGVDRIYLGVDDFADLDHLEYFASEILPRADF